MIKKIIVMAVLAALLPASSFAYWGIGLKGGAVNNKSDDMENEKSYMDNIGSSYSATLEKLGGRGGLELFLEGNGASRMGLSVGLELIRDGKLNVADGYHITPHASAIPMTLYWKHKSEGSSLALWFGAGAAYIDTQTKYDMTHSNIYFFQNKIVPHADAGIEWYVFRNVSLGVNLGCLFGAKFDALKARENGTDVQLYTAPRAVGREIIYAAAKPAGAASYSQDYSGLRGELALRVYFGGSAK